MKYDKIVRTLMIVIILSLIVCSIASYKLGVWFITTNVRKQVQYVLEREGVLKNIAYHDNLIKRYHKED